MNRRKDTEEKKIQTTLTITKKVKDEFLKYSYEVNKSMSSLVETSMLDYIKEYRKNNE